MKKRDLENLKIIIIGMAVLWMLACLLSSHAKATYDNCGKSYPVDYIVYTNLFCPIGHS